MAKGPLRLAIEDFLLTSPPGSWITNYRDDLRARQAEIFALRDSVLPLDSFKEYVWIVYYVVAGSLYIWTGWRVMYELLEATAGPTSIEQGKASLDAAMGQAFSNPQMAEIAELLGSLITNPVLDLFEQYAGKDDEDPRNFAKAFHGLIFGFTLSGAVADALAEVTSAGAIKAVGNMVQSAYWNLGLGFLGWQTLAPLLSAGLQPGLTRYYNKLYTPMRFNASQVRDLYALGEASQEEVAEVLRSEGWRDDDINKWITLAFRTLPQSAVFDAYHQGLMTEAEAVTRLRALGYDPNDIPLLFELNPAPPENELKDTSSSTLRQAYRNHLISAAELRQGLQTLKYSPQEIDLIVGLEDLRIEADQRTLTVGQIKSAWTENVIGDVETRHYLSLEGFADEQINLLLDTWTSEIVPVFRKVNAGTVIGAYVEHIYNRQQAHDRLTEIGFTDEDATLELDLAELRNPDAFNPPAAPPEKNLTPGQLGQLLFFGLITFDQMVTFLVGLHYSQENAELLSQAAVIRATPTPRQVPYGTVLIAYRSGVVSRDAAKALLVDLGYNNEAAETVLLTVEAQFPEDFGAPPEVRERVLSESALVDLTVAGIISENDLQVRLTALNYNPTDIELILARVAQLKAPPVRVLTAATVLQAYLVGVLNREQVTGRIEGLNVSPEDTETLIQTFELDHPEVFNPSLVQAVRQPTIAALVAAVQKGLITEDEYTARAQDIGYSPPDSALYLALATRNERKSTVQLSPSQVVSAYNHGFYSYGKAQGLLSMRGYSDEDATILLRISKDLIQNTDTWYAFLNGQLSFTDALTALLNLNYSDTDVIAAFSALPAEVKAANGIDVATLTALLAELPGGE